MAILSPSPKLQFFDANGNPLVGGKLYTYAAGTTTPLASYTDSSGGTANTNPIILDSRGEANVWLASGTAYKFVLQSAASATIWTVDNIDATLGTMASQNANNVAITGGSITGLTTFTTTNGATLQGLTVGKGAGSVATNTAVGASALASNTTGAANAAFGYLAGSTASTATDIAAFGNRAGRVTTVGVTAVGSYALDANTTGANNSAIGNSSLASNTTGANNSALGWAALYNNTTGSNSTAVGYQAAYTSSTGGDVTAIGYYAYRNGTASYQTAIGYNAMGSGTVTGTQSVAVGRYSLGALTSGNDNVGVGDSSLSANTTGSSNTAIGRDALKSNTTASYNTAVGYQAGYSGTTGANNQLFGMQAGYALTTGSDNFFAGYGAGGAVTTGNNNTIIGNYNGNQGGLDIRTANNYIVLSDGDGNPRGIFDGGGRLLVNTAVGLGSGNLAMLSVKAAGTTNTYFVTEMQDSSGNILMSIRADGLFTTASTGSLGPYNYTTASAANMVVNSSGQLQRSTSSLKYKKNVQGSAHGLVDVLKLRSVTYEGKAEADAGKVFGGLIAEEVHEAGLTEFVQYADDGTPDALNYGNMVSLAFKAIQELKAEFDAYKATHP